MALSEIEKLERRYAENPQGLTFAPLAEVHRKNGEVQRALDLLGPGLQIHPDYIPASIVLGRCHMDLGDVHAAEKAFLHVLALDGENVIALKALADISERLLKFDDAERWLNTLLIVDRSNDDAREQLQRVEITRRQALVGSSAAPSAMTEPPVESGAAAVSESAAPAPEPVVEEPVMPDIEPAPMPFTPPVAEPVSGWLEPSALPDLPDLPEPSLLEADEPSQFEPLTGLVGREIDTPDEVGDEFRVETSEDIVLESAGGSEFQMPDASQELFADKAGGRRTPFDEDAPVAQSHAPPPAPEPPPVEEPPPAKSFEPAAFEPPSYERPSYESRSYDPPSYQPPKYEPPSYEPPVPEPEPVAASAPEPEAAAPPPAPEPEPIADYHQARRHEDHSEQGARVVPPKRSYDTGQTGGRSVAQFFQSVLSARPPAQAAAPAVRPAPTPGGGAPTRPAADALSLSSVFGEEATGTPPAVPNPNAQGSVSFDDFFSSPGASPAARTPRAPDPKNDDLDQFHAWLQNLKR